MPKTSDIIAGALFEFCGYLTTLKQSITVGSSNEVCPLIDLLQEWAKTKGLDLNHADVKNWISYL